MAKVGRKSKAQLEKERKAEQLKANREKFLKEAEAAGLSDDYLFVTTFRRYDSQVKVLEKLGEEVEQALKDGQMMVMKEYVKGRENLYINPVITQYDKTTQGANQTAMTLERIVNRAKKSDAAEEDGFLQFIASKEG
jgi:hypothetical protein